MERIRTDICVIGAGSGGLSVAAGAVQMGARVVLVEGDRMGGDCLNAGCVPSKALIAAAHRAQHWREAGRFGLGGGEAAVDFAAVKDRVDRVIAEIAPVDSQERFEGLGVRVLRGWAHFTASDTVEVPGLAVIRARRFVIATGSRPVLPDVPGIETVTPLTNETIFALRERPAHLVILGGGPIGVEMAQAHRRLGCAVTLVEGHRCLGREDAAAAAVVLARLTDEGVRVIEGAAAVRLRPAAGRSDGVELVLSDGQMVTGSHLLVAAGRAPALGRLNLPAAHVAHDARGVTVGPGLRSVSNGRVFAVGDAAGQGQFTHLAGYHAGVVIRQAVLGLPARAHAVIPRVTYTDPELAQVGPHEAEARKTHGDRVTVLRADFAQNDRAVAMGARQGFVTLIVLRGRLIGATVVGQGAGELAAMLALAVQARLRLSGLAQLVLPYPTLAETVKRAAGSHYAATLFQNPWVKRWVGLVQRALP